MDILLLRLEGAMMAFAGAFSGPDSDGPFGFPFPSALTGLIANALGWSYLDGEAHDRLQDRLRFVAGVETPGALVADYQTAALSKPHMLATEKRPMWGAQTGAFAPVYRGGSSEAKTGTDVRTRSYWCGRSILVAMTLEDAQERPTVPQVAKALLEPARPLFLGRTNCPPSAPILAGGVEGKSLVEALARHLPPNAEMFASLAEIGPRQTGDRVLVEPGRRAWTRYGAGVRHPDSQFYVVRRTQHA